VGRQLSVVVQQGSVAKLRRRNCQPCRQAATPASTASRVLRLAEVVRNRASSKAHWLLAGDSTAMKAFHLAHAAGSDLELPTRMLWIGPDLPPLLTIAFQDELHTGRSPSGLLARRCRLDFQSPGAGFSRLESTSSRQCVSHGRRGISRSASVAVLVPTDDSDHPIFRRDRLWARMRKYPRWRPDRKAAAFSSCDRCSPAAYTDPGPR
jgi:hypothetical protein